MIRHFPNETQAVMDVGEGHSHLSISTDKRHSLGTTMELQQ